MSYGKSVRNCRQRRNRLRKDWWRKFTRRSRIYKWKERKWWRKTKRCTMREKKR
jgi:hypothetical protein